MNIEIKNKALEIIANVLQVKTNVIEMDMSVGDLPEWDSLHHIMIIKALEDVFDIHFESADLAELEDVSDLINLIEENKG